MLAGIPYSVLEDPTQSSRGTTHDRGGEPAADGVMEIWFDAPPDRRTRKALKRAGAQIMGAVGPERLILRNAGAALAQGRRIGIVHATAYEPERTATREDLEDREDRDRGAHSDEDNWWLRRRGRDGRVGRRAGFLYAEFFDETAAARAVELIEDRTALTLRRVGRKLLLRVSLSEGADALDRLAGLPGVRRVGIRPLPETWGAEENKLVRGAWIPPGTGGSGQLIAIADGGLDTGDPGTVSSALNGRVDAIVTCPVSEEFEDLLESATPETGEDLSGHGTHVASVALASAAQGAELEGLAPGARLFFQAMERTVTWKPAAWAFFDGRPPPRALVGIPADLGLLLKEAYDAGARIHSNSWGGSAGGAYDDRSEEVDQFVADHRDMLVLFAAGNDGLHRPSWPCSPATARNVLTVGACENNRPGESTWGSLLDITTPGLSGDPIADQVDRVAPFSSPGPTRYKLNKPDLMAPGTRILGLAPSGFVPDAANGGLPAAVAPGVYMSGTSMATPLVAGAAALVRQWLQQPAQRALLGKPESYSPSAALLRAVLIHACKPIQSPDGSWPPVPDPRQGWGRLRLDRVLNDAFVGGRLLVDAGHALDSGEEVEHTFEVPVGAAAVRASLVYTDYPGPRLLSNLNLILRAPDGTEHLGNDTEKTGTLDGNNNVEVVHVPSPRHGTWTVIVVASSTPFGPQDWSLVATWNRSGDPPPGPPAPLPPPAPTPATQTVS